MTLSQFLDRAIMGNLTQVTVIHGKGTGAVRKAVHTYLKRCKGVASFRPGPVRRGGGRRHHCGAQVRFPACRGESRRSRENYKGKRAKKACKFRGMP